MPLGLYPLAIFLSAFDKPHILEYQSVDDVRTIEQDVYALCRPLKIPCFIIEVAV